MFAVCIYFICGRRPKYDLFILPPVSTSAVLTILRSNKRENSKDKNDCPSHIKCFPSDFLFISMSLGSFPE